MTDKLRTIIVEDEEYDRKLMEKILLDHYKNDIEIIDSVSNKEQAIFSITKNNPDLVFLDIELDGDRNGAFNILNVVEHKFMIIFVTAKSHMDDLIKAIRLSCIDYIIKPTKIDDFSQPIEKAKNESQQKNIYKDNRIETFKFNVLAKDRQEAKISLQNGYTYAPVNINKIIRCESEGNYSRFYFTDNDTSLINGNLKSFEDKLNEFGFCRIGKQDLINMLHIKSFSRRNENWEVKMVDDTVLYVSAQRRTNFMVQYNKMF